MFKIKNPGFDCKNYVNYMSLFFVLFFNIDKDGII